MNKTLKNIIVALVMTSLTNNIGFAEVMDLKGDSTTNKPVSSKGDAIGIVKDQAITTGTIVATFEDTLTEGQSANGSYGVTISAAYLTADKKFGYAYVNGYRYTGVGTVVAHSDAYNSEGYYWGTTDLNSGSDVSNNRLYINTKNYFVKKNGPVSESIRNLTTEDFNKTKSKYNIQTDNKGKQFIATTFYVRYTYDIYDSHNCFDKDEPTTSKYRVSTPVLKGSSYKSGPYIGMGDYFDASMDVVADSGYKKTITDGYGKYFLPLSEFNVTFSKRTLGITKDLSLHFSNLGTEIETNQAMLEKRFEYRRYLSTGNITITNKEGYEVVYPVTTTQVKTQTALPDISPSVSVKSKTHYSNSNKTSVSKYEFTVDITTKSPKYDYSKVKDLETYIIKKPSDIPSQEPDENSMDFWHTGVTPVLDIIDSSGKSRLKSPISLETKSTQQVIVEPKDIVTDSNGSKNLDNCTAVVKLSFKNNVRFMSNKAVYTYSYTFNDKKTDYDTIMEYISKKETGLQLTTEIKNYQSKTNPREELTYKTETSKTLSVEASTGISSITAGDYAGTRVGVSVDPPNTLTVLEGGKFDVNVDINTNGVPVIENGSDTWISDFKIDEVLITSAKGDTILRQTDISPSQTSSTILKHYIQDLTAKPSHIGKATVKVTYSYIVNRQTYERVPIEDSGKVNANGVMEWDYKIIKGPIDKTPQNGVAYNYFNIFSVTGNSVPKTDKE